MVYGIVKQHGGYINVESEPGQGTLFTSYFPVTEEEITKRDRAFSLQNTFRTGTETVLVVDDDAAIRSFVTNTLTQFGYTCLCATNGSEALQLAQNSQETIDLLLTDVVMPEMNGPELATLFSKQSPGSKIIFMSGYMSDVDFSDIVARKDAFLQKPVTPQKLLNKLEEVLDVERPKIEKVADKKLIIFSTRDPKCKLSPRDHFF